jgi:hypothetical protein
MSESNEFFGTPSPERYPANAEPAPLDEGLGPENLFQEINERRARIENAELLRRLRGL